MYSFIYNLNNHPYFMFLASFSSIIGFIISIYLMWKSSNIAKILKHISLTKDYNNCRTQFIERFKGYKTSILTDDVKTKQIVHDILEDVYKFEIQYQTLLSKFDLFKIFLIKFYLKRDYAKINFDKICNSLDYLIGLFHKKEE